MLLQLLINGEVVTFLMVIVAIILSLSLHEFGHAWAAKLYGDDTAERLGRLTINPISHIDPMGLLMVCMVGFGYAKPVPFDPRNFKSMWATAGVAAAGPFANLIIALVVANLYSLGAGQGWGLFTQAGGREFFFILLYINLLLMLFNLIPLGVLDGHHIMPYFLPRKLAQLYREYNAKYGMMLLLGIFILAIMQVPVLSWLHTAVFWIIPKITFL